MIALKLTKSLPNIEADFIGVDYGAYVLASQNIHMIYALGDFDSVRVKQLEKIRAFAKEIKLYPSQKNESDGELAIAYAINKGYQRIVVLGGLGKRKDHEYVNIQLCAKYPNVVEMYDERNHLRVLTKGKYTIFKDYQYLSIFPLEKSCVTLTGVTYPLFCKEMDVSDIYGVSNQIQCDQCELEIHSGKFLLIESNDIKK